MNQVEMKPQAQNDASNAADFLQILTQLRLIGKRPDMAEQYLRKLTNSCHRGLALSHPDPFAFRTYEDFFIVMERRGPFNIAVQAFNDFSDPGHEKELLPVGTNLEYFLRWYQQNNTACMSFGGT